MPNRLAAETSPYLQQHADNPVDWYPWGEKALERARAENKPILLSIGYSACHWCHVMAHESFEDDAVAALMNRLYVNIKVDREERPDLDQIYQSAHYLLTRRSGGWPLTLFLTPDQVAFAGGTYFPNEPRHGMPGFKQLLARIEEVYRTKRVEITQQNAALVQALANAVPQPAGQQSPATDAKHDVGLAVPDAAPIAAAVRDLSGMFDAHDGGLGQAPKFPHPFEFDFLLRRHAAGDDTLGIVRTTLVHMAEGGIYDQIGGGFCRYSTDAQWTIPHFEKMLYDNGPLLALFSDAWRVTGEPLFARVVADTAAWVMREMQSPAGGYYSSLDADSEHEEGKFYVWTPAQVRDCLSTAEWALVEPHYGLDRAPNFEGGHWHLRISQPLAAIARSVERGRRSQQDSAADEPFGNGVDIESTSRREAADPASAEVDAASPLAACESLLGAARAKLLARRETRVRPGRDEKILVSWNALMIRGMARAGRQFERADWIRSAQRAIDFIRTTMWHDGRLFATHRDGKTHLNAYLDDYAFLLDALLESMQAQFRVEDVAFARTIADAMLARFEDEVAGGFFFTSHDHERLIQRTKPMHDNATPSGNGIAAFALQRLGHVLGEARYLNAAARTLELFGAQIEAHPSAATTMLNALTEFLQPPCTVVLRGPATALPAWRTVLAAQYRPYVVALAIPNGVDGLPQTLTHSDEAHVNAWICRGVNCLPPLADPTRLSELIAP